MFSEDIISLKENINAQLPTFNGKIYVFDQYEDNPEFAGIDDSIENYIFIEQMIDPKGQTTRTEEIEPVGMRYYGYIRVILCFTCANVPKMVQLAHNFKNLSGSGAKLMPLSVETNREIIYNVLYDEYLKNDRFQLVLMNYEISKVLTDTNCFNSLVECGTNCCK